MPRFELNANRKTGGYESLSEFAKAYCEAGFFTNWDCGHDDERKADRLGTSRLTRASLKAITADCEAFQKAAELEISAVLAHGETDLASIARDFWFTRQGHGVGFWECESRGYLGDMGERLNRIAKGFGGVDCQIWRGWIHVG